MWDSSFNFPARGSTEWRETRLGMRALVNPALYCLSVCVCVCVCVCGSRFSFLSFSLLHRQHHHQAPSSTMAVLTESLAAPAVLDAADACELKRCDSEAVHDDKPAAPPIEEEKPEAAPEVEAEAEDKPEAAPADEEKKSAAGEAEKADAEEGEEEEKEEGEEGKAELDADGEPKRVTRSRSKRKSDEPAPAPAADAEEGSEFSDDGSPSSKKGKRGGKRAD